MSWPPPAIHALYRQTVAERLNDDALLQRYKPGPEAAPGYPGPPVVDGAAEWVKCIFPVRVDTSRGGVESSVPIDAIVRHHAMIVALDTRITEGDVVERIVDTLGLDTVDHPMRVTLVGIRRTHKMVLMEEIR